MERCLLTVNMAEDTACDMHFTELSKNVRYSEVSYSVFRFMSKVEGRHHVTRGFSSLAFYTLACDPADRSAFGVL